MYPQEDIDLAWIKSTKFSFTATSELNCSPDQLFDIFEDAHAWTVWAPSIKKVEWTSPQPFGVGTTRTVYLPGGMEGYEEFIAWQRGQRMAFKFTHCNKKSTRAFGEDYIVTDLGNGRCHLEWTMAMAPAGFSRVVLTLIKPFMARAVQKMLNNLAQYVDDNVSAAAPA